MRPIKAFLSMVQEAFQEFQSDNAGQMAASLAYYAMFSIFPLLLLLIATFGFVLSFWDGAPSARESILAGVQRAVGPSVADTVDQTLSVVQEGAGAVARNLNQILRTLSESPENGLFG